MASRVQPLNLINFTGGLNLRADAFELGEDESPDMLNVDIDPRGGFFARRGWSKVNTADVTADAWDPRLMFVHELSNNSANLYLVNAADDVYSSQDDGVSWAAETITPAASPHGCDFAQWGDVCYGVAGYTQDGFKFNSVAAKTALSTQAEGANFSEIDSPISAFPRAETIASHSGYMFVGATEESGATYPYRLRWSHPNNPEAWRNDDYIDIKEGGGHITALVPMRDHLLVFQQAAVWALFGYDGDSWQLVNVSRELGAIHRQAVARSESATFFYSHSQGVFAITDGSTPQEISVGLRPAFESSSFNGTYTDDIWLGWIDQRLWFSVPYHGGEVATDARTTFVWDPSIGQGAWNVYRAEDGETVGPFAQGGFAGGDPINLGAHRTTPNVLDLKANALPIDNVDGTPAGFDTYYTTRWMNGGYPTLKKSWRRPDFVVKERSIEYDMTVEAFHDYDEANVERTKLITVPAGGSGAVYGDFVWGDGTVYGPAARGSTIERGGNLGSARAVALRITGEPGRQWGVDAVIFKMIPRRLR